MSISLAVIILTHDEEIHVGHALKSVARIADEIFVVDSFSSDRTIDIATRNGAIVLQHPFENYARQFQWALENAPVTANWILRLDADEIIEPDLSSEIIAKLPALPPDIVGVNLRRKHIFMGRWIRHGGRYPLILLRIWRRGHGKIEDRWMDEHVVVWGGRTVTFEGDFSDINRNDLTFFVNKHNKYATREAIDVIGHRYSLFVAPVGYSLATNSLQAAAKRFVKEVVYNRVPFEIAAFVYFLYRYVLRLGFLDGREGLIYHALQGFWYRFLVGAKVRELENAISGLNKSSQKNEIRSILAKLTGLNVL